MPHTTYSELTKFVKTDSTHEYLGHIGSVCWKEVNTSEEIRTRHRSQNLTKLISVYTKDPSKPMNIVYRVTKSKMGHNTVFPQCKIVVLTKDRVAPPDLELAILKSWSLICRKGLGFKRDNRFRRVSCLPITDTSSTLSHRHGNECDGRRTPKNGITVLQRASSSYRQASKSTSLNQANCFLQPFINKRNESTQCLAANHHFL